MSKEYIFGPVASRRLGVSLGVDLIRSKTCSLDCIYCEAGQTVNRTCCRQRYVDLEKVKSEIREVLADNPPLDYITFSGSGEPTLNSQIGEFSAFLKENYPQYKICLLTNGTLLNDPEVRAALKFVDIAMPNFDASNDEELFIINRPAAGITTETLAAGIKAAASEYPGKLVLELFIVPGVNDSDASIERFVNYIADWPGLHSVQLNTLDRPGVVDWIKPADSSVIRRFIDALEKIIPVEAVGRFRYRSAALRQVIDPDEADREILALISRRPATAEDLAVALNRDIESVRQRAETLVKAGVVSAEKLDRGVFYSAV